MGSFIDDDDCIYVGEIRDFKAHGEGSRRCPNGFSYVGQWKEGFLHGKGVIHHNDQQYAGTFKRGLCEGRGQKLYFNEDYGSKCYYTGDFSNGEMSGSGKMACIDDKDFEGDDYLMLA